MTGTAGYLEFEDFRHAFKQGVKVLLPKQSKQAEVAIDYFVSKHLQERKAAKEAKKGSELPAKVDDVGCSTF